VYWNDKILLNIDTNMPVDTNWKKLLLMNDNEEAKRYDNVMKKAWWRHYWWRYLFAEGREMCSNDSHYWNDWCDYWRVLLLSTWQLLVMKMINVVVYYWSYIIIMTDAMYWRSNIIIDDTLK